MRIINFDIKTCRFLLALFIITSCNSVKIPNDKGLSSISETWKPTKYKKEWWYATGWLQDSLDNLYFHQFTIFHGRKLGFEGYASHIALTDYSNRQHYFKEDLSSTKKVANGNADCIKFQKNELQHNDSQLTLTSSIDGFMVELNLKANKVEVAHGDKGIVQMGKEKQKAQSGYLSITNLSAKGVLTDTSGYRKNVSGEFWYDRQFGNFNELHWHWYSIRMFNGEEFMLFNFPSRQKYFGTQIGKNGETQNLDSFEIELKEPFVFNGDDYPVACQIRINPKAEIWTLAPVLEHELNVNKIGPDYWEGLCRVLDEQQKQVGWAVVEITSP